MTRGISERDATPVAFHEGRFASGERSAVRCANDLQPEAPHGEQGGFSGTCRNASLADWVQLIQMGRRDAVIVVRTPGYGEGLLWCKGGDIIDARWDDLVGEEAVYRILSFETGAVTVDFTAFERPRAIRGSTAGLLLEAAFRRDTGVSETPARRAHETPHGAGGGAFMSTAPTVTGPPTLPPAPGRARKLGALLWVGAAAATLGLTFWLSWRGGSHESAPATGALVATAAPTGDYPVHVEALPDEAEIRLDGQLVATRALTTRLPRDGRLHEMIVSARGYVPELVTFRDRPLTEQVALEHLPPTAPEPSPARLDEAASGSTRRVQLAHRTPSVVQDTKNEPESPPPPVSTPALKARIQTIDERQPRIQPIDDDRPRIESIE
jgi:hypothetical protein